MDTVLAFLVEVRRFPGMYAVDSRSLRSDSYGRMQRLSAAFHGTLGSYLRDAFQEGSADAVACLPVPRA
jgi:hypothetical protein